VSALNGRVAIVTGASRGIGRVIAQTFAGHGARVVCAARSAAMNDETVARIRDAGGEAIAVTADVSREDAVRQLLQETIAAFGGLDCLVNNAGDSGPTRPIQDYSTDDWHATVNSSLTSSYLCCRFAVVPMREAGGGTIVNIASMAARRGLPFRVGYCAAKAGQIGLTLALANELGAHNIRVNAIVPAAVEGDRIRHVITTQAAARDISEEEMRQALINRAPLRRMATAHDIATLAAFLCGDQARNISGQCIAVTAGEPGGG
jgi:NAD(P)-dependent dehydrogenase (short-subunit alcohol dehydrogenase family)